MTTEGLAGDNEDRSAEKRFLSVLDLSLSGQAGRTIVELIRPIDIEYERILRGCLEPGELIIFNMIHCLIHLTHFNVQCGIQALVTFTYRSGTGADD